MPKIDRTSKEVEDTILKTFKYDPESGIVTRILRRGKPCSDKKYYINHYGYFVTRINFTAFVLHRIAWFLHYQSWPKNLIDHINGNKLDNRISNLRDVNHRENLRNREMHRNGKLVGASFIKKHQRWQSSAWLGGKAYNLGLYDSEIEAHNVYKKALSDYIKNGKVVHTDVFESEVVCQK